MRRRLNSDDKKIDKISRRLNELKIETTRLEKDILELRNLRRRDAIHERDPFEYSDRHGEEVTIGCTVRFLTKGRFDSTTGKVTEFKIDRVIAKDYRGRSITRALRNVEVIRLNNTGDDE